MKDTVRKLLEEAFHACREQGFFSSDTVPDFVVEVPRNKEHGDLATNMAMVLAKTEKKPPREIAGMLLSQLNHNHAVVDHAEPAGPGFINLYLRDAAWRNVLQDIEEAGERFGASEIGRGTRVMVEFVSANPTGPLHIGHGRGAALGDALANILSFAGYSVQREYYINDVGNQMRNLGRAVYLRYRGLLGKDDAFPEDLYQGDYIIALAQEVADEQGERLLEDAEDVAVSFFTRYAADAILQGIQEDLALFGVNFDTWFSEKNLFDSGSVQESIDDLKEQGLVYESDGAVWFAATRFGDEKDRVLVKEDGQTTYFASDISYHRDKFKRGFQRAIDIWGADHHGYVPRIRAVLDAMGVSGDAFSVILVQMVNLLRDGTPVAMSTRRGEFVTLRQVIDEVGSDAARFIFLTRRSDAQLDFDLNVAKKQSDENPVYYVQYAHARISSIIAFAQEKGHRVPGYCDIDGDRLSAPEERDLIRKLAEFPDMVAGSATSCEPHRIATYLLELVGQFHSYYNKHRAVSYTHLRAHET